jgi:tetratricopeptide (TPR) repeat protein
VNPLFASIKKVLGKLFSRKPKTPPKKEPPKRSKEELLNLLEKYQEAVRANPQDGMGHYNLGEVYVELTRFSEALPSLKEAIRINPKLRSGHYQLGFALVHLGRDDEAIEPIERALQLDSKSQAARKLLAEAHTNLSIMLGKRKQHKESIKHIQEAIKVLPDYGPAHLSLGICYTDMGRYQDAVKKIQEALRLDKHLVVDANFNLGVVYSKLGDTKKAIKHYQEAIQVNPKSVMPNLNLGMLYSKLKNYQEAIQPLRIAIKVSPKMAREAHFKLGVALMKLKRFKDAVKPLQEAVKITPNNEKVRDFLAEALYQTSKLSHGEPDKAEQEIEMLKEAVEHNPEHVLAHYGLGQAYDKANQGYYAIVHTLIAKQFFVEAHQDDWIARSIRAINSFFKKYHYTQKDFAKVRVPRK